jgi:hypothetical protein
VLRDQLSVRIDRDDRLNVMRFGIDAKCLSNYRGVADGET